MKKSPIFFALLLVVFAARLSAVEGFWLAHQLQPGSAVLRDINADSHQQIPALPLQQISQVVARIGNCSAAFVSARGLLITSAHCIDAFLQQPAQDIAPSDSRTAELPLPGLQLDLLQQTQDVTVSINRQLSSARTEQQRTEKLQLIRQQLLANCQQQSTFRCELISLHHGSEFYLQQYRTLHDVRLVYHPPQLHDSAERVWPQYGADFVLLRAYVSATGAAAQYAPSNQPFQSAFARLSEHGVTEHELIVSPGFSVPASRYATVAEVRFQFEQLYPSALQYLQQAIQLITQLAPADSKLAEKYATTAIKLQQQSEKTQAMVQQYRQSRLLGVKQQHQQALLHWMNSSPLRQQLYGPTLEKLRWLSDKQQDVQQRDLVLTYLQYAQLPFLARQLYHNALQPKAPQAILRQQLMQLDAQYDARLDMELALHFLGQYAQLPQHLHLKALDQYFALNDGFNREIVRHKLSAMYRGTSLTEPSERIAWLTRSPQQFEQSNDPLISFAVAMQDTAQQLVTERAELSSELNSIRAAWMEVVMAYNDTREQATYAQADGLLHFSLGRVSGYQPMDAVWYQPFSHLSGLMALQHAAAHRNIPLRSDSAAQSDNISVNFLSSTDSCSDYRDAPSFNAAGELVGVMYSGVQENLLADWHYDASLSRAVHVDSRYVIWQLRQSDTGQALLEELLP
jgi:hypothetical protein